MAAKVPRHVKLKAFELWCQGVEIEDIIKRLPLSERTANYFINQMIYPDKIHRIGTVCRDSGLRQTEHHWRNRGFTTKV